MSRKKQYNREEALERAVALFQRKGFHGTSIESLVNATQMSRASLYNEFSDKKALYVEAVDQYSNHCSIVRQRSQQYDSVISLLIHLLSQQEEDKVCFMVKATVDMAEEDREIQTLLRKHWERRHREVSLLLQDLSISTAEADATTYWIIALLVGTEVMGTIWPQAFSSIANEQNFLDCFRTFIQNKP